MGALCQRRRPSLNCVCGVAVAIALEFVCPHPCHRLSHAITLLRYSARRGRSCRVPAATRPSKVNARCFPLHANPHTQHHTPNLCCFLLVDFSAPPATTTGQQSKAAAAPWRLASYLFSPTLGVLRNRHENPSCKSTASTSHPLPPNSAHRCRCRRGTTAAGNAPLRLTSMAIKSWQVSCKVLLLPAHHPSNTNTPMCRRASDEQPGCSVA